MFFAVGGVGLRIVDGELVCALGRMLSRHRAVAGRNVNTPKGGLGDNWLSWKRSFKYPTRRLLSRETDESDFLEKNIFLYILPYKD